MSKRHASKKQSLHHGAVERELRRLHEQGSVVEHQRNLIRTVLSALVLKHGGSVKLSKSDFSRASGGSIEVGELENRKGGLLVVFTPREGVLLTKLSWWRRWWRGLLSLFGRSEQADAE